VTRPDAPAQPILAPGRSCWRVERAERRAFLIDGEAYFGRLADALENAREQVLLIGWDFHGGMRLRREPDALPLVEFLDHLARRRPSLRLYLLDCDFPMLYALERENLPTLRFGARTHRRVRFRLDGNHPFGASQHQKLIVIDDAVAFLGGFDLAACRWDGREHRADDPRRSDPGFSDYRPFHDVGVAVAGPAAAALGALARERWHRATGRRLPRVRGAHDPWPRDLAAQLRDVDVGLARTLPAWDGQPEVHEIETLWLDSLQAATRSIYVENQYLTAARVADALCERLRDPDGPELVIVGPRSCSGWLEQATMGAMRARVARRLWDSDAHGRLALLYPELPGPGGPALNVHSKLAIVDDELLRIGSANLSNRSMRLDSEIELAVEARGDPRVREAIASLRAELLGEHHGCGAERLRAALAAEGTLRTALERLDPGPGERRLAPLDPHLAAPDDAWLPARAVADPERPVSLEELSAQLLPEPPVEASGPPRWLRVALVLAGVLAAAALWRWTPLSAWARPEALAELARPLRTGPAGPPLAAAAIALSATAFAPVTALIVASGLVFGPWLGAAVGLVGALASALLGFAIGRRLWPDAVHRLLGPRLRRVSHRIAGRGVLAVAAVRIVPVAPFAAVNLAAGASRVGLRDFATGTLLAMAPGALALTTLAERLRRAVFEPGWESALALLALAALVVGATWWLQRRFERASRG
jgi:phosphatidylserine/phosphatidylglycerophosphate/cardiolipin synthase-like enzyme/uncharacterized membrane protein YdjX (TVP38/TMEM64 family)